jgi:hypothetical protein
VIVGVSLLVGAGSAFGQGSGLFYSPVSNATVRDASVNGNGVTHRAVNCPSSHPTATGGGAEITGDQSGLDLELKSSGPVTVGSGPDKWDIQANNSSGSQAQMTYDAICAKGNFRHVTVLAQVPAGTERVKTAKCPKGTKLAGGGVTTNRAGDHATEIGDSAPAGKHGHLDAWRGNINNGSSQSVKMAVTALCAESGSYRVVKTQKKALPNGAQLDDIAVCPKGTKVSSGGVLITGTSDALEVASSAPWDSGDANSTPDNGWHGVANNDGSGTAQKMQVFAVCKS